MPHFWPNPAPVEQPTSDAERLTATPDKTPAPAVAAWLTDPHAPKHEQGLAARARLWQQEIAEGKLAPPAEPAKP